MARNLVLMPLLATLAGIACSPSQPSGAAAGSAVLPLQLDGVDTTAWVTLYDPERAWAGYTLDFYRNRIPILMDMNGRVVHSWPEARVKSRIRLLPDGSLLGIALGKGVVEYSWDGELVWRFTPEDSFAHHDVIRLANGNTVLLVANQEANTTDSVLEVDRAGAIVWRWDSLEHLADYLPAHPSGRRRDLTHINSVQELPPNDLYDGGDQRFRPGNLLLSSRTLNRVVLIDKQSKRVVWTYADGLDLQHEALMIERGWPGAGNILIFNNRYRSFATDRQSEILEIDPQLETIARRWTPRGLYSPTSGVEQPLPNGNILIGSTRGGRVFEIDRKGETVWEWVPPLPPNRPARYPYDHTPQLAAMARPDEVAVRPPAGYRLYDVDTRRFARAGSRRVVTMGGRKRTFLATNNLCANVLVPPSSRLESSFGLDPSRLPPTERQGLTVQFALVLRPTDGDDQTELLFAELDSDAGWRQESIDMSEFADRFVELCVETERLHAPDAATESFAFWEQPSWDVPRLYEDPPLADDESLQDLTDEEIEARRQHLRTMGYVD
jgi:hypothetical protein